MPVVRVVHHRCAVGTSATILIFSRGHHRCAVSTSATILIFIAFLAQVILDKDKGEKGHFSYGTLLCGALLDVKLIKMLGVAAVFGSILYVLQLVRCTRGYIQSQSPCRRPPSPPATRSPAWFLAAVEARVFDQKDHPLGHHIQGRVPFLCSSPSRRCICVAAPYLTTSSVHALDLRPTGLSRINVNSADLRRLSGLPRGLSASSSGAGRGVRCAVRAHASKPRFPLAVGALADKSS